MKILQINKFLYPKGGDAICTLQTGEILSYKGHEVAYWGMAHSNNPRYPLESLFVDNVDYNAPLGKLTQLKVAIKILYSFEAKRKIREVLKVFKPDVAHLHNFAHQISPSIIDIFKKDNIPTVMTMHDYKIICPAYSLLQLGTICKCCLCRNGAYYHCLINKCVKNSRLKSLVNTIEMYLHHKILHIYDHIHTFIAPSQFLKKQVEDMGFKGRVVCIPNSLNIAEFTPRFDCKGKDVIYMGRLVEGKGIFSLIKAFDGINSCSLKIIGEGPLDKEARQLAQQCRSARIEFLGYKTGQDLMNLVKNSMFVVVPSEWYENNPRSVIESFALGKPVLGARVGGIPELVRDNETGLTFEPWNVEDLRNKINMLANDPVLVNRLGRGARSFVERELNADKYYERLMAIYNEVILIR